MVPVQVLQIQEQLVFTMLANFYHCGYFTRVLQPFGATGLSSSDIFSTFDAVLCWHFSRLHAWYKTHGSAEKVWQACATDHVVRNLRPSVFV